MQELARDMENLLPTQEKWREIVDELNRCNCVDRLVRVGQVPFRVGSSDYVFDLLCERSEDSEASEDSGWVKRVHFRLASEASDTLTKTYLVNQPMVKLAPETTNIQNN